MAILNGYNYDSVTIRVKLRLPILVLYVRFQAWVIDHSLIQNLDEPKLRQSRDYTDGFKLVLLKGLQRAAF